MTQAPHEIELKFSLPAERAAELAQTIPELADAAPVRQVSVYFDTPKRTLSRAGFALRVRRSGDSFVQTLKDGGDGVMSRGEWEAPLSGGKPSLAKARATPAGQLLPKGVALEPQFSVDVLRRKALVTEGDSQVEFAFDQGVAKARDRQAAFAELELELKVGPVSGVFAAARRVIGLGDLTLSFTTKAERGATLARPPRSQAQRFRPPALNQGMTSGAAFQAIAKACLVQIAGNAERLRHRPSPEVIHQARVGLRRLRSLNTTFKTVVGDSRLPAIKAELKWLTAEFDAARSLDVLLKGDYRAAVLQRDVTDGLKNLGARLRAARRLAYARAATAGESERFRRLLLDLLIWIETGPWIGADVLAKARDQRITKFARAALTKRRRKILRRGRELERLSVAERHKLRIDAKKLRYAADVFEGLFDRPKRAAAFIDALKEVQDALGDLNDIAVGERLAHDTAVSAGLGEADTAFVAGRITGVQKSRVPPLLTRAHTALEGFEDVKPFWT
ncbi:MAG TPA: CHAD domain-containing protein [Caulobacteraceae bacterium]|nr:CHAD domain-containing protein [Caulobacteraceae bacterium]